MTAGPLRSPATAPSLHIVPRGPVDCEQRFRLRAEYIERLAEFNAAAARHQNISRVGMSGPAAEASWRNVQEKCAASNAAWARYRQHLSAHGCRRPRLKMEPAA